jgi:hypothetical protein
MTNVNKRIRESIDSANIEEITEVRISLENENGVRLQVTKSSEVDLFCVSVAKTDRQGVTVGWEKLDEKADEQTVMLFLKAFKCTIN